jgi:two-component system response regulator BaeR
MNKNILIVEDEVKLAQLMSDYLHQSGFTTRCIGNGNEAVAAAQQTPFDLILLDLMLPGLDGIEVCKSLRRFSDVPIIMVTARVDEIDRLLGLELGADDYICKPFSPREVVARVKAVLRRTTTTTDVTDDELVLDEVGYRALVCGQDIGLTAIEFRLLQVLREQPGRIFSRDQIMDRMYADARIVSDRTIDSHIKKLRKKMAAAPTRFEWILSVYSVGYKFEKTALA